MVLPSASVEAPGDSVAGAVVWVGAGCVAVPSASVESVGVTVSVVVGLVAGGGAGACSGGAAEA